MPKYKIDAFRSERYAINFTIEAATAEEAIKKVQKADRDHGLAEFGEWDFSEADAVDHIMAENADNAKDYAEMDG